ncbi:MAG TPA: rhodanese-like domain-containing protein [Planctomycetota bacterium]|nr:rhodanese-like domain-containing protein [Planctomycetota bacterium]
MDRTPTSVPSSSTVRKPPASVGVTELMALLRAKTAPALLDVREPAQFHPRHLRGSLNCPESQATALVLRVQALGKAVLICEDGSRSSVVTRTLGFCKLPSVAYLEGGLEAWTEAGGSLVETTRSGLEHELPPPRPGKAGEDPRGTSGWFRTLKERLFGANRPS